MKGGFTTVKKGHNWVLIVSMHMTEVEAAIFANTGIMRAPDPKRVDDVQLGCYDCELPFFECKNKPCKGER